MTEERFKASLWSFIVDDSACLIGLLSVPITLVLFLAESFTPYRVGDGEASTFELFLWIGLAGLFIAVIRLPVVIGWSRRAYVVECTCLRAGVPHKAMTNVVLAFEFRDQHYEVRTSIATNRYELMEEHGTDKLVIDSRRPSRCSLISWKLYQERYPERFAE